MVLVGAGHAHLHIAKEAGLFRRTGCRLVLVDPGNFWYSGMATGMLGGSFAPEADQIDPAALIQREGGEFLRDGVVGVDLASRTLRLASGRELGYDLLSFNVGSDVRTDQIEDAAALGTPVKPLSNLAGIRRWVESLAGPASAVVIGGGVTGCEVAANLAALGLNRAPGLLVRLLSEGESLLAGSPPSWGARLRKLLEDRKVSVHLSAPVGRLAAGRVHLKDGRQFAADRILLATGLRASRLMATLGLGIARDGSLLTHRTLQSVHDERVFAAGDCAQLEGLPLPKIGVYGVRAAPVLLHNLLASLKGRPLRTFRPQRRYLSIMDLGNGQGFLMRGAWCAQGAWCLRLKRWLDRRFIRKYRPLP